MYRTYIGCYLCGKSYTCTSAINYNCCFVYIQRVLAWQNMREDEAERRFGKIHGGGV